MKKLVFLIVMFSSFLLLAMSDSPKEEPKQTELLLPQVEIQTGNGFITKEELNRIAINYYMYMFSEEHEFRGWIRKDGESIIKNITPFKEDGVTLAYMVNFNPDGHVLIRANKNFGTPIDQNGSGNWTIGVEEGFANSLDARLHPVIRDGLHRLKKAYDSGTNLTKDKDLDTWQKFNVPVDSFKERHNFDDRTTKPKWWLEKKKSKNTQGMIQSEWYQTYPFNKQCPRYLDTLTVVGCTPLAMAQVMKYHEWPINGIGYNSYSWYNGRSWEDLSQDFSIRSYNLSSLPAYADSLSQQSTICRDAGIAVDANYGIRGTEVIFDNISSGFAKHFNYTVQLKSRADWFSTSDTAKWMDSLKYQISWYGPIIYGGLYTDATFSGMHTWIVDDYDSGSNLFHFNMGWQDTTLNDWYPTDNILSSHYAVFNLIPDKESNALTIPYKQNFDSVMTGDNIKQIPINTGVSKTDAFYVEQFGSNKALCSNVNTSLNQDWFMLKKINLNCDSVPVFRFKFKTLMTSMSGTDSITVFISNNNRLTWDTLSVIDRESYLTTTGDLKGKIISLRNYRNSYANLMIKFNHTRNDLIYFLDSLEVGQLELKFTELVNDTVMPPRTAQSIKVTPSMKSSQKSKNFEDYDVQMDFYIKKDDGTSQYALAYTDSILENGIFEYPDWNTDDSLGVSFKIRAVARTKSDNTTLTSTEVRVKISGRQCHVDLPLPATESWFDFETRLNFELSILAEPSFADSLDNVYIGFDVYDDYNTETNGFPISIFEWYYPEYFAIDSTVYFCEFEKNAKSKPAERKVINPEVLQKIKETKPSKRFFPVNENMIKNISKDLTSYFALSYRYPQSLDLCPGTYTVSMMAIRKDIYDNYGLISEIAKSDSSQFIIPQWKMKLRRDYWFANTVVPYKQNLEYEAGKIMQIIFWRPWPMPPFEPLYLDIVRETDNTVVQSYEVDFNSKAAYDLIEWTIPSETVPGFYNLKANNLDYWTNITVNQQIDPQVCPLYLSWENSGEWPANWPGSDSWDWEIHAGAAWTPAMGAYSLGAKYSTEGNTGEVSINKTISIDSEWESVLEFAIGAEKEVGTLNFYPLLADYSIATSIDGANWTIEKTATLSDYTSLSWSLEAGHCFVKFFKPLGHVSSLGVKFIKDGIVTAPPDSQVTLFDEVKSVLTKTPLKAGPTDPSVQYAGGNVSVGWSGPAKDSKALDQYYVYRNGVKIGETTEESYVDSTVYANTFYNYAITAHYNDGSTYPESPMNECSVSVYTGLYSPSDLVITNENPNIRLTWSPVSGASEYKVYSSDDPYGTFTEDTTGTFDDEEWTAPISTSKLFYYVVAVNESMKEKKIVKTSDNQVK